MLCAPCCCVLLDTGSSNDTCHAAVAVRPTHPSHEQTLQHSAHWQRSDDCFRAELMSDSSMTFVPQVGQKADALHVRLAIVSEADRAAGDALTAGLAVRCDALPHGGGSLPDAYSAVGGGGGDWRTATLRLGEAYPAEAPCVEFQSSAVGFGSRQASANASLVVCTWLANVKIVTTVDDSAIPEVCT